MLTSTIGPAPEQRRVYAAWFEGMLLRSFGQRLTPALISDLRAAGLDLERPLADHYPASLRLAALRLLREHLLSAMSDEQAWHALGHAAVDGFIQTLVGKAFAIVFRTLGPRALMKRAGSVMASASNYVSGETVELGPFRWEARLEGADLPPAYYRGLVLAALEICKVKDPQIQLVSHVGEQVVLSCTWAPPSRSQ